MADPKGFLTTQRENQPRRPVDVRIRDWREVLPAQSVCLTVPVVLPCEYHEPQARRYRERAQKLLTTELASDLHQASGE